MVLGAYRDRLIVELAQNAADAAVRRAGPEPAGGRLRLTLTAGELRAANTGEPLDAAGVEALATLRASAKRDQPSVGRFGVGFSAALTVSDAPVVASRTGGVRFDLTASREAAAKLPELAGELARREGRVPVLRLPWPGPADPPEGYDTEIRLPLRAGTFDPLRESLTGLTADLLLALDGLSEIEVVVEATGSAPAVLRTLRRIDADALLDSGVVLERVENDVTHAQKWRIVERSGVLDAALLESRPVEERTRPQWTVKVGVPVDDEGLPLPVPDNVVHAPTPTDEPLSLPARLIATYPLASDRRRVVPGPVADVLTRAAASAYADLLASLPRDPAVLALVPRPTLAGERLDAELATEVSDALRETAWLPEVGTREPRRPAQVRAIDAATDGVVDVAADAIGGLLPAPWCGRGAASVLTMLGVRRIGVAELIEELSGVDRPSAWWRDLYAALDAAGPSVDRGELGALPVPLADGRVVRGPRGLLVPDGPLPASTDELSVLGLRVVDPEAAHPLLERLGAVPSTAAAMLDDERVRAAVEQSIEEPEPEEIAGAVLALATAAGIRAGERRWLGRLALPGDDGEHYPAEELVLPGSPADRLLGPASREDPPLEAVDPGWVEHYGPDLLLAVGVIDRLGITQAVAAEELDLDAADEWLDDLHDRLPAGVVLPELAVAGVNDLELVAPDSWPEALALLDRPDIRAVIETPLRVSGVDGEPIELPSYTRWWLSTHPILDGQRPDQLRLASAAALDGLYDVAPVGDDLARLAGCLTGLPDVLRPPDRALDLLDRLAEAERTVPVGVLSTVYSELAAALEGERVDLPAAVRVAPDLVVPADRAAVLDAPYLFPMLGSRELVPAGGTPGPVADLLELPLATELVEPAACRLATEPVRVIAWSDLPGADLAAARLGLPGGLTGEVGLHDELSVAGPDGEVRVMWWPGDPERGLADHVDDTGSGVDTLARALGRALAYRHDAWPLRAALAECFAYPEDAALLSAEDSGG